MRFIYKILVAIWKVFSLPYRITKMLSRNQENEDAKKLLDMLKKDDKK